MHLTWIRCRSAFHEHAHASHTGIEKNKKLEADNELAPKWLRVRGECEWGWGREGDG